MPVDWRQLLNTGLQVAGTLIPRPTTAGLQVGGTGGLTIPNQLLGAGALGLGYALDREPGEATEARQFLRNRFTSPTALTDQFTGQLGAIQQQYQPLLAQQRERDIADIQQRFISAFPKTVGAQGPEFGTLARYITDQALPREQAVMADLGQNFLNLQGNAATNILNTSRPDPMAQLATLIGYDLLTRPQLGMTGGGTGTPGGLPTALSGMGVTPPGGLNQLGQGMGTDGASLIGQLGNLAGLFTGGQALQQGLGLIPGAATLSPAAGAQLVNAVSQMLGGTTIGAFEQVGSGAVSILDQAGNIIGGVLPDGTVINGATGQVAGNLAGGASAGFQGVMGPAGFGSAAQLASAAGSALGSGFVGYHVGSRVGDWLESPGRGSDLGTGLAGGATGAATGAAMGALIGDGPGAVIGAIVGGIAGAFGGAGAENRRESAQAAAEEQFTSANRPAAQAAAARLNQAVGPAASALDTDAGLQQASNGLAALMQAGDPSVMELANAFIFDPLLQPAHDPANGDPRRNPMALALAVKHLILSAGPQFSDAARQNPDSYANLLGSNETGRFNPAVEELQRAQRRASAIRPVWNALASRLGLPAIA